MLAFTKRRRNLFMVLRMLQCGKNRRGQGTAATWSPGQTNGNVEKLAPAPFLGFNLNKSGYLSVATIKTFCGNG
jgi:hypothetical protein